MGINGGIKKDIGHNMKKYSLWRKRKCPQPMDIGEENISSKEKKTDTNACRPPAQSLLENYTLGWGLYEGDENTRGM
jgi:hypothetical protein